MYTLEGKTALVTGSGRGIGRAIARHLASAGASVMLTDIDAGVLKESEAEVGARSKSIAGDITDPHFPAKLVEAVVDSFGSIDIVVNNAGYTWDNVIQKTSDEQFQ